MPRYHLVTETSALTFSYHLMLAEDENFSCRGSASMKGMNMKSVNIWNTKEG